MMFSPLFLESVKNFERKLISKHGEKKKNPFRPLEILKNFSEIQEIFNYAIWTLVLRRASLFGLKRF